MLHASEYFPSIQDPASVMRKRFVYEIIAYCDEACLKEVALQPL